MSELIPRLTGNSKTFKCLPFLTKFFENSKEVNKISKPRILGLVSPSHSSNIQIQIQPNTSKNSKIKPKKSNQNQLPIYSRKDINKIICTGTYKKINLSNLRSNNTPLTSRKKISNNKLSNWKRPSYILNEENYANNKSKNDNINININITGYHSPNRYSKNNKNFNNSNNNLYIKTSNDCFGYNNKKIYKKKEVIEKNCKKSSMNSPNKYPVNMSSQLYLKKTNINNANHKCSNSCCLSKEFTATKSKISNNDHFLKEQKYRIKKINIKNKTNNSYFHHNKTPENTHRNSDSGFSSNYFSCKSNNNEEEMSSSNNDNVVSSVLVSPKTHNLFNKNMEDDFCEKNNDKDVKNIKCPEELHYFYVESLQKSKLLRFDSISKGTIENKK